MTNQRAVPDWVAPGTTLALVLLCCSGCANEPRVPPVALHPEAAQTIAVSPGVELRSLVGPTAPPAMRTDNASVALFRLAPGRASHWSYNRRGQETFLVLKGRGSVWVGDQSHSVRAGSYILVPPNVVRSIRASAAEALEFYAITAPAWRPQDDVLVDAPNGAPANEKTLPK